MSNTLYLLQQKPVTESGQDRRQTTAKINVNKVNQLTTVKLRMNSFIHFWRAPL